MADSTYATTTRRRQRRIRVRRRRVAVLVLAILLTPVGYSYVSTMLKPSSLPLGVRSIEWLRAHHGAWLINEVERTYYRSTAPKKGGPTIKGLPRVGHAVALPKLGTASYAPRTIAPAITPRLPHEGVWEAAGPTVRGRPPVLVTTFRPQADYPRIVAYVAWIDSTRTRLDLFPGRYEPPSHLPRGSMDVPQAMRRNLVATFNSGFTYGDGHGGFFSNGRSYTPLTRGYATLVGYRDGSVNILSWRRGPTPSRDIVFARQNLPLLVAGGHPSVALRSGGDWGATLGNAVRVWRSGIGVDARGNLIYAAADYQTAATLAALLIHAGAVRAMELDINSEWPSFNTYWRWGAGDPTRFVPNAQQSASRYLVPDDRDFFAVFRR
ncbi:MAG: phosphodiester glycosidase family protein [Gaiellaceae bacterium]